MRTVILHLSDLHFGRASLQLFKSTSQLLESLVRAVESRFAGSAERWLVLSGDIVYQGSQHEYSAATEFVRALCARLDISQDAIVVCPGNHDIDPNKSSDPFHGLNAFIHSLTRDSTRLFSDDQPNRIVRSKDIRFLVLNSAFHGDHTYGFVKVDAIPDLTAGNGISIAVVHHNLLGIGRSDTSAIRNAYPLVLRLVRDRYDLVLHGHQHMLDLITLGEHGCVIAGAGSLNFKSEFPNQFNCITIDSVALTILRYTYLPDLRRNGQLGGWYEHAESTTPRA